MSEAKRFTPNLSGVDAGIPLLEHGDFEFVIGEPKAFIRQSERNGIMVDVYGVSTSLKVVEGPSHIGKTIPWQMYLHTEGSQPMVKQFLMASYGYGRNGESEFNEQFDGDEENWFIDTETGEVGEAYKGIAGKRIMASVTQRPSKRDPNVMQNSFTWLPA